MPQAPLPVTRFYNDQVVKLAVKGGTISDRLELSINHKLALKRRISYWNMQGRKRLKVNGMTVVVAWRWSQLTGKPTSISVVIDKQLVIGWGDDSTRQRLQRRGRITSVAAVATKPSTGQQVFISYRRQDLPFATALYDALAEAGYRPWLDLNDIQSGEPFQAAIDTALHEAERVVVIASPWSVGVTFGSQYVLNEWATALRCDPKRVLTVLVQDLNTADLDFIYYHVVATSTPQQADRWQAIQWLDVRCHPAAIGPAVIEWIQNNVAPATGRPPADNQRPPIVKRAIQIMVRDSLVLMVLCLLSLILLIGFTRPPDPSEDIDGFAHLMRAGQVVILTLIVIWTAFITRGQGVRFRSRGFSQPLDSIGLLVTMTQAAVGALLLPLGFDLLVSSTSYAPYGYYYFANPIYLVVGLPLLLFLLWLDYRAKPTKKSKDLKLWTPVYPASALGILKLQETAVRQEGLPQFAGRPARAIKLINHPVDQPLADFFMAQLHITPTTSDPPDTLIILMSRALMKDPSLFLDCQRWLGQKDVLIVPIQIEDCRVWADLNPFNWIDAMNDIDTALNRLRSLLRGERSDVPTEALRAPLRPSTVMTIPFDDKILTPSIAAPVIKIVIAVMGFFVGSLAQTPATRDWLAFATLFVLSWLQFVSVTLVAGRRIAFQTLQRVYLATGLAAILPLGLLWGLIEAGYMEIPYVLVVLLLVGGDIAIVLLWSEEKTMRHWLPLQTDVSKPRQGIDWPLWVYIPLLILGIFSLAYLALTV